MHYTVIVLRRNFNRSMGFRSGGTANQQGLFHSPSLHFMGHMHHFIKGWCDQSAETDDIRILLNGFIQYPVCRNHHAKVNNIITIAAKHYTNNIFADIVDIAFNGGE